MKNTKPRDMNIRNQIAQGVRAPKFEDRRTKRNRTRSTQKAKAIKDDN